MVLSLLWRFVFGPFGWAMPFGAARIAAWPLGSLLWWLGVRRTVVLRNLALVFPGMSGRQHRRIGRQSVISLVTTYLELPTLHHLRNARLRQVLAVQHEELLQTLGPNGALLLSGHVGNWELLAFGAAAITGVPFAIVVKHQRDFGQLTRMRTARGNSVIPTDRGARETTRLLRAGGVVAMLADQAAADHEPAVPMFGVPTHTYSAPARLALRYRPDVVVGFAVRQANGTYRAELRRLEYGDLDDSPEGARQFTARYVAMLESVIREHPEQWVWQHRKWKNTPGVSYDT